MAVRMRRTLWADLRDAAAFGLAFAFAVERTREARNGRKGPLIASERSGSTRRFRPDDEFGDVVEGEIVP